MKRILKISAVVLIAFLGIFLEDNPEILSQIGLDSAIEIFQENKYEVPDSNYYFKVDKKPPQFTENDLKMQPDFQEFSPLDNLNRVGQANALIGPDSLPKKPRGDISKVHPTGWHQKMYDFVEGRAIYNRCHLIAYSLTGENDNWLNLMTGTRSFNTIGMEPFERIVRNYIYDTGKKVRYRVTPIFLGDELLARGVIMEAYSIEDNGKSIKFRVLVKNIEKGVKIDYKTGRTRKAK